MEKFLSNSWVVSIVSGIIVFVITSSFMVFQDKRHNKKKVYDANIMILNHLRSYVVDNELPEIEIINALKNSLAREYGVKYEELLSTKSVCEDLVKDILGNNYISNDNQKKYITMLHNYIKQINTINVNLDNNENESNTSVINNKTKLYMSSFAGLATSAMGLIMTIYDMNYNINSTTLISAVSTIILIIVIVYLIMIYIKKYRKK